MQMTSIIQNGEETIFFEYGSFKAWAKCKDCRWHVQVKFFYANGRQAGQTADFIYPSREHVMQCFSIAKEIADAWRNGKCA